MKSFEQSTETVRLPWSDVVNEWRQREEEVWRELYTQRGFADWTAWRESYFTELRLAERAWQAEVLSEPHTLVHSLYIGGFPGWFRYRPQGSELTTFAELAVPPTEGELNRNGELREDIRSNPKVAPMIGALHDTSVIVLRAPGFSTLLEGTHRMAALAAEEHDGNRSAFTLTLQVADFTAEELPFLQAFARERRAVVRLPSG
jgi:hypothetical protein